MDSKCFIEEFCSCDCHEEVLRVCFDPDENEWIELSIYEKRYKYPFWNRFRLAYRCLRNGTPYTDQIILDKERVKNLIAFFNKFLE